MIAQSMQADVVDPRATPPSAPPGNPADQTGLNQGGRRERRSGAGVAWLILLGAAVHPPHGWGVVACPSRWVNGLPCPGCGLSRSVSCAIRGMWSESWSYHPFGVLVLASAVGVAVWSLVPRALASRLRTRLQPVVPDARAMFVALAGSFVAHGVWRMMKSLWG